MKLLIAYYKMFELLIDRFQLFLRLKSTFRINFAVTIVEQRESLKVLYITQLHAPEIL